MQVYTSTLTSGLNPDRAKLVREQALLLYRTAQSVYAALYGI